MPIFDYQFATVDQLLVARDAVAAVANDWQRPHPDIACRSEWCRLRHDHDEPSHERLGAWLVWTLAAAAVCFFVGLGFATGALFQQP